MSNPVWKCKECEYGPCYIQCKETSRQSIFGDIDNGQPQYCPYFHETQPEFEVCAPEANPWKISWIDQMQEWIMGDGYENAPEEIRDGLAIDLKGRLDRFEIMHVIGLLRNYEEDCLAGGFERDELIKKLGKLSKWELLNAIFPEAFKAGLIYGEMIRQRNRNKSEMRDGR